MTPIDIMACAVSERFSKDGGFCSMEAGKEFAYDIRKALEEAGFVIVPVEPTEQQLHDAYKETDLDLRFIRAVYKAMLEAAK